MKKRRILNSFDLHLYFTFAIGLALNGCITKSHGNKDRTAYIDVCDNWNHYYDKNDSLIVDKSSAEIYTLLKNKFIHVDYKLPDSLNLVYAADLKKSSDLSYLKIKKGIYRFKILKKDDRTSKILIYRQLCAKNAVKKSEIIDSYIRKVLIE